MGDFGSFAGPVQPPRRLVGQQGSGTLAEQRHARDVQRDDLRHQFIHDVAEGRRQRLRLPAITAASRTP